MLGWAGLGCASERRLADSRGSGAGRPVARGEDAQANVDVAILFQSCHKLSSEVGLKFVLTIAFILTACGKSQPVVTPDTGSGSPGDDATAAVVHADADPQSPVDAPDGAVDATDDAGEVAEELRLMQRLGALEVPGMARVRSQVHNDHVTLQFETAAPNAKGNTATIEVTIGLCAGCVAPTKVEVEDRKAQSLAQLGELHAKNPGLVFELDPALELMPQRNALATYVRSFVDDGVTRAAMHTLEVTYIGFDKSVRLLAYPRSGFPQSQAELAEAFSKEELVAAVKAVFAGAAAILWP